MLVISKGAKILQTGFNHYIHMTLNYHRIYHNSVNALHFIFHCLLLDLCVIKHRPLVFCERVTGLEDTAQQ